MDTGKGGEMKIETQEVEAAIPELEPLKNPTQEEIDEMMGLLGYDALKDSSPDNRHQRRQVLSAEKLYRNFHAAGKHGELFVLRGERDRIIGLVGLRADAPNQTGHITLLRTGTREKEQFGITEKLLIAAEHYLRQSPRSCTKAIIEAERPSEHLQAAAHHGARANFYEFKEKSEPANDNKNPLEQAA